MNFKRGDKVYIKGEIKPCEVAKVHEEKISVWFDTWGAICYLTLPKTDAILISKAPITGYHKDGVGTNPHNLSCGECNRPTCYWCPHENRKKSIFEKDIFEVN